MDFLKLVRSLEERLYEVMTWLVFYPRTMWQIAAHPAATTRYSEDEETQAGAEQYTDTLSPPLLLMLTILIAHGLEIAMGARMLEAKTAVGQALFGSAQNLLMLRALLCRCYLAAPFALAVSAGLYWLVFGAGLAALIG